MQSMEWKEEHGYGIVDLKMVCSTGSGIYFTNNTNGFWNSKMACPQKGFLQIDGIEQNGYSGLVGREEGGYGIINVKSICYSGISEKDSNLNLRGHWNQRINCPNGQIIVGMSIREQPGFGIINFKSYCGTPCPICSRAQNLVCP